MLNNARAETVANLPSFRSAFAAQPCIVPAEALYKWKRDGKLKQPFAVARLNGAQSGHRPTGRMTVIHTIGG